MDVFASSAKKKKDSLKNDGLYGIGNTPVSVGTDTEYKLEEEK